MYSLAHLGLNLGSAGRYAEAAKVFDEVRLALDALFGFDGDEAQAAEGRALSDRILGALPDETMRRRFIESEVVQRLRRA